MPPARPRALIVEDDDAVRASIAMLLGVMGIDYSLAADGEAAMRQFDRDNFDVAMIDQALPDTDGDILSDRMRKIDPGLPIVMMSSNDRCRRGEDTVLQHSIYKPAMPGQLRELLDHILSGAAVFT